METSSALSSSSFELLSTGVQRWVWRQGWQSLRAVQEQSIPLILNRTGDVLIEAATAAGKTEAAFMPIASHLAKNPAPALGCIYVAPLKALINDQHVRLEGLLGSESIEVTRWHGDAPRSPRQRLLANPTGVVLITPESLEALFVNQGHVVPHLVRGMSFVVVDEVHTFIGTERGRQLQMLMHRIELAARKRIMRIGLSATVGDRDEVSAFLRHDGSASVAHVLSAGAGRELKLQLRGYRRVRSEGEGEEGDDVVDADERISDDIFELLRGTDNLVFANRRSDVEQYADNLRRRCLDSKVLVEFFPHHGNLAKEIRLDVEERLRAGQKPTTAVCTSTLELGIDIGSVTSIGQIDAPQSASSLRQRLGRSGRKPGDPSILRMFIAEREIDSRSHPQDELRPALVQSMAIIDLMLAHQYDPPPPAALHLSTLVQQVLSIIAQHGGASAADMWPILCSSGPFKGVDRDDFLELLRELGRRDLVIQAGDGTLLLGRKGERIVNHYSFYAAFTTPEEYRLIHGNEVLGDLPINFSLTDESFLIFAGRRWRVLRVDESTKRIEVVPAPAGRPPRFIGGAGAVHDAVRQRMATIYEEDAVPPYLDAPARTLLAEAREAFRRFGLATSSMLTWEGATLVFPWAGDREMNTIALELIARGLNASSEGIIIEVESSEERVVRDAVEAMLTSGPSSRESLAANVKNKNSERYHWTLTERLLNRDYASSQLAPETAWVRLAEIA